MKIIIVLFLLLSIQVCHSQSDTLSAKTRIDLNKIYKYNEVDVKPDFPGGWKVLNDFIYKNYEAYEQDMMSGKVELTFMVEKDGRVSSVKALRSRNNGAADRLYMLMRANVTWAPAKIKDTSVRCSYTSTFIMTSCK